jgi:hypothetical protein
VTASRPSRKPRVPTAHETDWNLQPVWTWRRREKPPNLQRTKLEKWPAHLVDCEAIRDSFLFLHCEFHPALCRNVILA